MGPHPYCLMKPQSVLELWEPAVARFQPQDEICSSSMFSVAYLTNVSPLGAIQNSSTYSSIQGVIWREKSKFDSFPQVFLLFQQHIFCYLCANVYCPVGWDEWECMQWRRGFPWGCGFTLTLEILHSVGEYPQLWSDKLFNEILLFFAKGSPRNATYYIVPPSPIQTISTVISCAAALHREQTGFGSLRTHLLWLILK